MREDPGDGTGVAVVAVFAATLGASRAPVRPDSGPEAGRSRRSCRRCPATSRSASGWIIGVKCDAPPFGYINVQGKNAGFDVEIARWFARFAFGKRNRARLSCVTTPAREPALTSDRVDLVISTFTYTADRDTRIDFSRPYFNSTGRLLVKNDSPIQRLADIRGRKVATTSGSIYDRWMEELLQGHEVIVVDGQLHERAARVQPGPRRRAHVRRHRLLVGHRGDRPAAKLTTTMFLERSRTASGSSRGTSSSSAGSTHGST